MNKRKRDPRAPFKPLENIKFFLDFKGYRPHDHLVRDLKNLGAVVEPFFGRDVSYVVTDKQDSKSDAARRKPNSVDSGGRTTSPFANECSRDGPCTSASVSHDAKIMPRIARGQAMVQRAVRATSGPTDVLALCRQWKIKILYIKNFMPWLEKLKRKALLARPGKENAAKAKPRSNGSQKLVSPFIKFEDTKGVYRPFFKNLKHWPHLGVEVLPEDPVPNTRVAPTQGHVTGARTKGVVFMADAAVAVPNAAPTVKVTEKKKFHCEICSCHYHSLQTHLESQGHQQFMRNASNFSTLADLVSTLSRSATLTCTPSPLTEVHPWGIESSNASSNESGRKVPVSRAMLSVKGERSGIIVQSSYCGSLSSVKYLKVVRGFTEPSSVANATPVSPRASEPRKRPLFCSDMGPPSIPDNRDVKSKLFCSDPIPVEKEDHLVPPSHSADNVENSLLANMYVESSATGGRVAEEEHSTLVEHVEPGRSRHPAEKQVLVSQDEPLTMEYSWTDAASGFAVDSCVPRKGRSTEFDSGDSSFSRLVSAIGAAAKLSQWSELKDASDAGQNGPCNIMHLDGSLPF